MKTVKISKQTFNEIKKSEHGVPRDEKQCIVDKFRVGREYLINYEKNGETLLVRCTQNCPYHLIVK